MLHECSYSIRLHFETKNKLISVKSQALHHFVRWHVKCVEKVPFRKSGHIYSDIIVECCSLPMVKAKLTILDSFL